MDPSDANLVLWIEPTSLLRSGLLKAVFPSMAEAMWLVWQSWAGAAGSSWCGHTWRISRSWVVRAALPPGPGALLPWFVWLIPHDRVELNRSDASAWYLTWLELA
jgi:hypothetical protein